MLNADFQCLFIIQTLQVEVFRIENEIFRWNENTRTETQQEER